MTIITSDCGYRNLNIYIIPRGYKLRLKRIYPFEDIEYIVRAKVYNKIYNYKDKPVKSENKLYFKVTEAYTDNVIGPHVMMIAMDKKKRPMYMIVDGEKVSAQFMVVRYLYEEHHDRLYREETGEDLFDEMDAKRSGEVCFDFMDSDEDGYGDGDSDSEEDDGSRMFDSISDLLYSGFDGEEDSGSDVELMDLSNLDSDEEIGYIRDQY